MHCLQNMNKSPNPYVFLFLSQLLALLGPFTDQKTNFPALHVVQILKSLPFWSLKKVPLSRGAPSFRPLYGIPPPGLYQVYGPSKVFSSSLALSSEEASFCRREAGDKEKVSARLARWDGEREAFRLADYRPFRLHSAPVSKHKKMRSMLGWTISYKSLYFVHPSLNLMSLFTGMRERSIAIFSWGYPVGESVPSTTLFHQIHVIWCRKYNWLVLKIFLNKLHWINWSPHTQISLCLGRGDLGTMSLVLFTSSNFCGCCCCLLVFLVLSILY